MVELLEQLCKVDSFVLLELQNGLFLSLNVDQLDTWPGHDLTERTSTCERAFGDRPGRVQVLSEGERRLLAVVLAHGDGGAEVADRRSYPTTLEGVMAGQLV